MPRHSRLDIPGAVHHVIIRGLECRRIFNDDNDYQELISRFEKSLRSTSASCYAWALMPNHIHLLVRTGYRSLSELMRGVLTGYAVYFNKKNKRHGYLYQNRYKSILCQEDAYFLKLVAYIHLNPLRAKLVKSIKDLENYKWCGHATIMGKSPNKWQDTEYVLSLFASRTGQAREKYMEFLDSQFAAGSGVDLMSGGLKRSLGGWEGVEEAKRDKEYWRGDERLLGDSAFVDEVLRTSEDMLSRKELLRKNGWDIEKVIGAVCRIFGVKESDIMLKGRNDAKSKAKAAICCLAYRELGLSGVEIGRRLGITKAAVGLSVRTGEVVVREKGVDLLTLQLDSVP